MPGVDMRVPEKRLMRTVGTWSVAVTLCGIAAWSVTRLPGLAVQAAHPDAQGNGAAMLTDWLTDGGDNQRTGWNKNEKIAHERQRQEPEAALEDPDRQPVRALHALMPVLVVGQLNTPAGAKQVGFVNGISDNLYAFDVETGKILWQKHWDYEAPAGRAAAPAAANRRSGASRLPASRRQQRHAGHRPGRRAGTAAALLRHRRRHAAHPQRRRPARISSRRTCSTPARAGRSISSATCSGWRTPTRGSVSPRSSSTIRSTR